MFAEPRNVRILWPNPDNVGRRRIALVLPADARIWRRKIPAKNRRWTSAPLALADFRVVNRGCSDGRSGALFAGVFERALQVLYTHHVKGVRQLSSRILEIPGWLVEAHVNAKW
jgi:hypothetical protein